MSPYCTRGHRNSFISLFWARSQRAFDSLAPLGFCSTTHRLSSRNRFLHAQQAASPKSKCSQICCQFFRFLGGASQRPGSGGGAELSGATSYRQESHRTLNFLPAVTKCLAEQFRRERISFGPQFQKVPTGYGCHRGTRSRQLGLFTSRWVRK